MSQNKNEISKLFSVKSHLQHFIYTYYTKVNSIIVTEFFQKIPGVLLSFPEKEFLLSSISVVIFYLFRSIKFQINMNQNIFDFQNSSFFLFELTLQCHFPPLLLVASILLRVQILDVDRFYCH